MLFRIAADALVILHLLFIIFALLGGLLVLWRTNLMFLHIPAAIWAAIVSFKGWVCPLTPLENSLRYKAGAQGYSEGFVEHYVIPIIYPNGLNFDVQIILGVTAVAVNIAVYTFVYHVYKRRKTRQQ